MAQAEVTSAEPEEAEEAMLRLSEPEEQRCREYCHYKLILGIAETGVLLGVLLLLTLSGGSAALLHATEAARTPPWMAHAFFLILVGLIARAALLPVQFSSEYCIERRFGIGLQSLGSWFWEWFNRSAVFGLITVVLLVPVVESLRWSPLLILPWCLLFPVCRSLFYEHVYHPLYALFYPVRFLRYETFSLPGVGRITLPVYVVQVSHKTRRADASIRLRGKRTAIYVTDTLLEQFTDGEERVVMAHEFGHLYDHLHLEERTRAGIAQAHRKLVLGSAQLLAGVLSFALLYLLGPSFGLKRPTDLVAFPILAALTLGLAQLFAPFIYREARRDERDADQYALASTGDVDSYISVMRKLRRINLEESCATPISRLFFDTHPSYRERVHLALHYRRRHHPRCRHTRGPHFRQWKNIRHHDRR